MTIVGVFHDLELHRAAGGPVIVMDGGAHPVARARSARSTFPQFDIKQEFAPRV